jgi:hypothetical protein
VFELLEGLWLRVEQVVTTAVSLDVQLHFSWSGRDSDFLPLDHHTHLSPYHHTLHPPQPKVVQKPNLVLSTTIGKGKGFLPKLNAAVKNTEEVGGGAWVAVPDCRCCRLLPSSLI